METDGEQGEADPAKADHDPGRNHVGGVDRRRLEEEGRDEQAGQSRQHRDEGNALGEGIGMPPHQRQQEDLAQDAVADDAEADKDESGGEVTGPYWKISR